VHWHGNGSSLVITAPTMPADPTDQALASGFSVGYAQLTPADQVGVSFGQFQLSGAIPDFPQNLHPYAAPLPLAPIILGLIVALIVIEGIVAKRIADMLGL
jgi:hypothetical protein